MNVRRLFWVRKVDDAFTELLRKEKAKANAMSMKGLSLALTIFFLLPCLALDFLRFSPEVLFKNKLVLMHIAGLAASVPFYFIGGQYLNFFKNSGNAEKIDEFKVLKCVFSILILVLGILLSIFDSFFASNLLFYTLSLNIIIAFMVICPKEAIALFFPGLLILWVLYYNHPYIQSDQVTFMFWSSFITIAGYLSNTLLYNNFIERIVQKETIRLQNISLIQSNEAKDGILKIVAHDLRTPVANIDQLIELLYHSSTSEEERSEFLKLIRQSCVQAYRIIEDILDIMGNNKTVLRKSVTNLTQLIEKEIKLHNKTISQKPLHLHYTAPSEPVLAEVDSSKIERAIDNIITNAIKFTPKNGNLEIFLGRQNGTAKIEIKDSGIGIPEEMLPHVFEPFTRAGRLGLQGEKTLGLGLSIVKNIIDQHQGVISVTSKQNVGTTFSISLPVK